MIASVVLTGVRLPGVGAIRRSTGRGRLFPVLGAVTVAAAVLVLAKMEGRPERCDDGRMRLRRFPAGGR